MLYFAFVLPHLTLHIEIWGAAPECHIKKLATRQNHLLRAILNIRSVNGIPVIGTVDMYRNSNILTLRNLFKLQLFKFMFLLLNGSLPLFYDMVLRPLLLPHNYSTRTRNFRHPLLTGEVGRRAIDHQMILLHEETPAEYFNEMTLSKAKKHYKRFLLTKQ